MDARLNQIVVDQTKEQPRGELIYRQSGWTRIAHWLWAVALFFLLMSGLQIFNAHPTLYIGEQSGFQFDNSILTIGAEDTAAGPRGYLNILGLKFDTTGILGWSGDPPRPRAFPSWATVPSYYDLGAARVVHFFFAWALVAAFVGWVGRQALNYRKRHVGQNRAGQSLVPTLRDLRGLPRDALDHLKFRFHHRREYGPLQKLAYASVMFVMLPLMIATGLAMSPGANAIFPWLTDMLGGRQTARTIHFGVMVLLVAFFVVHMLMILAAGPFNEMRSIITGWYRIDPPGPEEKK